MMQVDINVMDSRCDGDKAHTVYGSSLYVRTLFVSAQTHVLWKLKLPVNKEMAFELVLLNGSIKLYCLI